MKVLLTHGLDHDDPDHPGKAGAKELFLRGSDRDIDDIVLVLSLRGLPFLLSTPMTVKGIFFILTTCQRGLSLEEVLHNRLAQQTHLCRAFDILFCKCPAGGKGPVPHVNMPGVVPVTPVDQF